MVAGEDKVAALLKFFDQAGSNSSPTASYKNAFCH
jgi:hypothetical protein